jgi:hypothetical protein
MTLPAIALLMSIAQAAQGPMPAVGDVVPAFDAVGLDGKRASIEYPPGSTTVLLFFLSSCQTCHRMIPEWNRLYGRKPKELRLWGVLLDQEPPGFFMAVPVAFPVVRAPGGDFNRTYKLSKVPLTLRVGPGGRVADVAVGKVDAMRLGELFRP